MRQHVWFDARGSASAQLTTLCYEYSDGYRVPEHFHDTDQVVFAYSPSAFITMFKKLLGSTPARYFDAG